MKFGGRDYAPSEDRSFCSVSLVVLGDDLTPDQVSAVLGLDASQGWRRGEMISLKLPDGTSYSAESVHHQGGWKLFTPAESRGLELQEQLRLWLDRLRG